MSTVDDYPAFAQMMMNKGKAGRRHLLSAKSVEAMHCETEDRAFTRDGWIFELKLDGYRLIASKSHGEALLLTRNGKMPTGVGDPNAVVGVWTAAYRRKVSVGDDDLGPWVQVSRLGNPLFNEVIVPMGHKDEWNALPPSAERPTA